jgi:Lar family restriction alleviation protein
MSKKKDTAFHLDALTGEISTEPPGDPVLINARHLDRTIRDYYNVMGWDTEAPHLSARDMATIIEAEPEYVQGPVHLNYDGVYKRVYKQLLKETREGNRNRCPFCGSEDTRPRESMGGWWIQCKHCGTTGPVTASKDDAIKAWRKRIWQKKKH